MGDPYDYRNWSYVDGRRLESLWEHDDSHTRRLGFGQYSDLTYARAVLEHPQYLEWCYGEAKGDCSIQMRAWVRWSLNYIEVVPGPRGVDRLCVKKSATSPTPTTSAPPSSSAQEPPPPNPPISPDTLVQYAQAILTAPPVALLEARLIAHQLEDDKLQHLLWLLDTF